MTTPFRYPSLPHARKHGPKGYANHAGYRPWLRDEFSFRCVFCLLREQWGRVRGVFDVEHFQPIAHRPDLANEYDNLLYACTTCNLAKGTRITPDPLAVLIDGAVHMADDGVLHATTIEAARLIEILGLNSGPAAEFRVLWTGIIALAEKFDPDLHPRLLGFPENLPDLRPLQPPDGNSRPDGVSSCFHARRERGELAEIY